MDKKFTRRQIVRSAAAGLLFTVTPAAFAKAAPQFVAVRIWPANAYSRITLESTEKLQYNYFTLDNPRHATPHTHGTGCTLSACITAELAKGATLTDAVRTAKAYISAAIAHPLNIGHGHGPVNHWAYDET